MLSLTEVLMTLKGLVVSQTPNPAAVIFLLQPACRFSTLFLTKRLNMCRELMPRLSTATDLMAVESQNMPEVQAFVISHAGSSRSSDSSHRDPSVSPGGRDTETLRERLGLQTRVSPGGRGADTLRERPELQPSEQISSMEESEQLPSGVPFTTGVLPLPPREPISSPEESQLPSGVPFTTDLPGHGPGVATNIDEDV